MKRSKRDFLDTYKKIRKPTPPADKVIPNLKDIQKEERFDWRREMDELEEEDDGYKGVLDGEHN